MQYALDKISTVSAGEALLAPARKKKQALENKALNLAESINAFRAHMDDIAQEEAIVQTLLKAYTQAYNALPDGKDKVNLNVKIKRTELRQARADKRTFTYSIEKLLAKQLRYNMLRARIAIIDTYLTELQNHIEALRNVPTDNKTAGILNALSVYSKTPKGGRTQRTPAKLTPVAQSQVQPRNPEEGEFDRNNLLLENIRRELGIRFFE